MTIVVGTSGRWQVPVVVKYMSFVDASAVGVESIYRFACAVCSRLANC